VFSEEEIHYVFWRYIVLCGAVAILEFCGLLDYSFGAPMIMWVIFLFWVVYSLFSWKDKREIFKRCVLALPFVLLAIVLLRLTVFGLSVSISCGVLLFIMLTTKTKNLKQHYIISLVTAAILIILVVVIKRLIPS